MHLLLNSVAKCFKHGHKVTKTPFKFQIMEKRRSGGKPKNKACGMVKFFRLVSSSLKNIILTKDKIKEVEIKCGVQAQKKDAKFEGWGQ